LKYLRSDFHIASGSGKTAKDLLHINCRINGQGRFSSPKDPELYKDFSGSIVHTSAWNDSVEYRGKRVAVVGTGSTAIQVVPSIAKDVESLVVFQRHAPWIFPIAAVQYSPIVQWAFSNIPGVMKLYRMLLHWKYEPFYYVTWRHKAMLHQKGMDNMQLVCSGRYFVQESIKMRHLCGSICCC